MRRTKIIILIVTKKKILIVMAEIMMTKQVVKKTSQKLIITGQMNKMITRQLVTEIGTFLMTMMKLSNG